MNLPVYKHQDVNNVEIKLRLPQGECFILADRVDETYYCVSVVVPWFGKQFYTGIDSAVIHDQLHTEDLQELVNGSLADLASLIKKALPTIEQLNRDEDLDI